MRAIAAALLIAGVAGCATTMRRSMPPAAGDWLATLGAAQAAVVQGHFDEADRVLSDFAQRYPRSPEAREAAYWRALYDLDPANTAADPRAAADRLDAYLSETDTTIALHRSEARTLRRIAAAIDSLEHQPPVVATPGDSATAAAARAQQHEDEMQKEIQRLRDQLDKTTAELDRIKKRLQEHSP